MNNDFSKQFRPILQAAYNEAKHFNSPVITSEHFVLGALRNRDSYLLWKPPHSSSMSSRFQWQP